MSNDKTTQEYAQLFDIPEAHCLKQGNISRVKQDHTVFETRWLDEYDGSFKLVARFRTWSNRSSQPPYKQQSGWERYSLSGDLLDREVRYQQRRDMEYVH